MATSSDITSILTEIHQKLVDEPLSQDQIANVHDGVAEHGRQASVREEILYEVTQLSQTISEIEDGFAAIHRVLKRIDRNKPIKINGERTKHAPAWEKLHNVFLIPSITYPVHLFHFF
jgi:tRNA/tmRNA/rRNA uracil-C5-methylase (TrmA/RlmC/RlmD family)